MTDNDQFEKSKRLGDRGENFMANFVGQCTGLNILHIQLHNYVKEHYYYEGYDLSALVLDKQNQIIPTLIEVKTYGDNKLMGSYVRRGEKHVPTLPIELWGNIDNPYGGWFYALTHCQDFNQLQSSRGTDRRALYPGVFIFLAFGGHVEKERQLPYVSISFLSASKFLQRLEELARKKFGWDISEWNLPSPQDRNYWNALSPEVKIAPRELIENEPCNWNVPITELCDLAHIVTIGEPANDLNEYEMYRYNYYKKLSEGKHFDLYSEWEKIKEIQEYINSHAPETANDERALYERISNMLEQSEDHEN